MSGSVPAVAVVACVFSGIPGMFLSRIVFVVVILGVGTVCVVNVVIVKV